METKEAVVVKPTESQEFLMTRVGQNLKMFELKQREAKVYTSSTIVPQSYRGNENIGNVMIALDMAERMNANVLMLMQNLYIVHGIPSFSSKFLIATINASGKFSPLRYEFKGTEGKMDYSCRAYCYEAGDKDRKEPLYGDWISMQMAKDEGWYEKPGSKWKTMPGQMLRYRAAAFWQRVYCPEISMGFLSTEEAEDIDDQTPVATRTVEQEIAENANREEIALESVKPIGEQNEPLFMK